MEITDAVCHKKCSWHTFTGYAVRYKHWCNKHHTYCAWVKGEQRSKCLSYLNDNADKTFFRTSIENSEDKFIKIFNDICAEARSKHENF
jgi:hypothetical protein